ncbi:MAG TPA: monothiol glutaredoxin, Grx4 family, partial [Stenotrophomonas sp.]|nr:monothiol glutaredoxin, Grx4 family [Stenotrophomonas sp.]
GGSDIILQMAGSGELSSVLGLAALDRTPPRITVTPAAVEMLRGALADAPGASLQLGIDARFQPNFQLAPHDDNAIAAESNGLRVQFDLASARRADGITIDWVDDIRGQGLAIDNPNAPKPVQELGVRDADDRLRAGTVTVVDVRPADERAIAAINGPFETFDGDNRARLEALPKDTALAFLCHHGGRSAQAAEQFRALGFTTVYNITGGIDAWSKDVDNSVPTY